MTGKREWQLYETEVNKTVSQSTSELNNRKGATTYIKSFKILL